jgi:acetate kinase
MGDETMADLVFILNAGSSSLKFTVYSYRTDKPEVLYDGQIEGLYTETRFRVKDGSGREMEEKTWPRGAALDHEGAIDALFSWGKDIMGGSGRIAAVGHRVVHGGLEYTKPTLIDDRVMWDLEKLIPMAPLHQPHNLAAIRAVGRRNPDTPQVACFDTSFHATVPAVARTFGLPRKYTEQGIRRYGFHGLSYEYIASVLPGYDWQAANGRTIVAHLGNGASMCALKELKSIACTLGFTAVDGLVMGTRCGNLDPGAMLFLMDQCGMGPRDLERLIYQESGLLGVSGISSDMRTLLRSDDPHAKEAVELFVYRAGRELGSLAAALGGIDALVFTGGIGEKAVPIREDICRHAGWLGLEFNTDANATGGPRISRDRSPVRAWVIPTDEELMIALHTCRILSCRTD